MSVERRKKYNSARTANNAKNQRGVTNNSNSSQMFSDSEKRASIERLRKKYSGQ